jgi:hypothetical protein
MVIFHSYVSLLVIFHSYVSLPEGISTFFLISFDTKRHTSPLRCARCEVSTAAEQRWDDDHSADCCSVATGKVWVSGLWNGALGSML